MPHDRDLDKARGSCGGLESPAVVAASSLGKFKSKAALESGFRFLRLLRIAARDAAAKPDRRSSHPATARGLSE